MSIKTKIRYDDNLHIILISVTITNQTLKPIWHSILKHSTVDIILLSKHFNSNLNRRLFFLQQKLHINILQYNSIVIVNPPVSSSAYNPNHSIKNLKFDCITNNFHFHIRDFPKSLVNGQTITN